jgi:lipoprotein antigen
MSAATDRRKPSAAGLWVAVVLGCVTACSSSAPHAGPSSGSSLGSQLPSSRLEGSRLEGSRSASTNAAYVMVAGQSATIDEQVNCETTQDEFAIDALAANNPTTGTWDKHSLAITVTRPDMAVQVVQAYVPGKFQLVAGPGSASPTVVPTISRSGNSYTVTGHGDDLLSGTDDVEFEIHVTCP